MIDVEALADGVRITGCTVHFVRAEMDSGPIIIQAAVPVVPGDTEDSLSALVVSAEHRIYPDALRLIALGKVAAPMRMLMPKVTLRMPLTGLRSASTISTCRVTPAIRAAVA